jgi:hypothetical protein
MTPNQERPSATIYAFPPGGRRNLRQRDFSTSAYNRAAESDKAPNIVCGSSWYHEAALDEASGH